MGVFKVVYNLVSHRITISAQLVRCGMTLRQ